MTNAISGVCVKDGIGINRPCCYRSSWQRHHICIYVFIPMIPFFDLLREKWSLAFLTFHETRLPGCQVVFTENQGRLNIKTVLPRYGDSHVKDKRVARPSYLKYGNSYTGKTISLYWDKPPTPPHPPGGGGGRLNIMIASYQYKHSHYKDKTVSRPFYLCNGNSSQERWWLNRDGAQGTVTK